LRVIDSKPIAEPEVQLIGTTVKDILDQLNLSSDRINQSKIYQGHGMIYWDDGSTYRGDFNDNKRTGNGVMKWRKECVYEGEWKNDQFYNLGALNCKNGLQVDGMFDKGKL